MSDYLTQAEVDRLPHGAAVEIVWSGGNGPHRYEIERANGTVWALVRSRYYPQASVRHPITFVGPEPPYTTVRLLKGPQ